MSATRLELEAWILKSVPVLGDAGHALEALIRERDEMARLLLRIKKAEEDRGWGEAPPSWIWDELEEWETAWNAQAKGDA